jgi:creatinine amidohydrolase
MSADGEESDMGQKKRMEEMSWVEFEEQSKVIDTILLPMGSVEVEGPHLPLAVDSIVASEVANRAAQGCDALVGPLVSVGYSDWHAAFPGTLSLSMETLTNVLREIMFALIEQGFKRFICINPHVGNQAPIFSVATELRKTNRGLVAMIDLWRLAGEMAGDIEGLVEKRFAHAGEIMTSVMLALRPDLVNMEKAKGEQLKSGIDSMIQEAPRRVRFSGYHVEVFRMSRELTDSGVMGDPRHATGEKGDEIIERWVRYIRDFVEEFKKLPV